MGAIDSGNTAWILTSASLVFLMTPGVAFFYGGMVRAKAVLNMLMLEAAALSVTMIIWTLWGWSIAYAGSDIGGIFGDPASGFLLKDSDIGDVIEAIDTVMAGGSYFSPQLLSSLTGRMRTREDAADEQLSSREREILVAVCRGLSNQEIADELFISKRTVDKHRANILEKTGCKNTASLVVYAIRNGIVEI